MRQFLLGKDVAYASSAKTYNDVPAGAFSIFVLKDGVPTVTTTGEEVKDMANLVLGRDVKNGGPVVIPLNKRGFKFNKGEYTGQEATTFEATVTIPEITHVGTYSLICVKKGKLFNDRHKWTSDTYVRDIDTPAATVAEALAKHINENTIGNGLTATVAGAVITIKAVNSGEDYAIIPADELMGLEVTVTSTGIKAYGDAAYVTDLACKAASEAGFEYTFEEDIKMYPAYPLNPLAQNDLEDTGFEIFNLTFYEGREVKNVDQVVRQLVQIAVPTGAACSATLETIFTKIAE
ncbi:MAG: putative tail sheath protein [crAssphage sp. isolate ctbg_1]|uniref:Putative tail sheath protein n=1 Tax=crAssphage sp. isolate ctbg_1 TaxID=2989854 RepID=A0A345MT36_9CAUD|nr:MAG: putative tail sheath protein [crAssphage sp. isolate ctbg_1]AXH74536.1 MAG: putative tail sheath protein [crAssphage sp. isolate ctbg_1]